MARTGVVIETEDGKIKPSNFGVLTAARGAARDNEVIAFLLEGDAAALKDELEGFGARKVVRISSETGPLADSPELQAAAVCAAADTYGLTGLLGLSTALGRDLFARVGAAMDLPMISDCIRVDVDEKTAVKSHFSGKTFASMVVGSRPMICTVRPNAVDAAKAPVRAEALDFVFDGPCDIRVKVIRREKSASGRLDLTEAPVIIAGGRAVRSAENFKVLDKCARVLNAAVGASRAAVDAGYADHSIQVGQTGKTVAPNLYLACGISGAVQHFAGMKTAKVIVAVNTDKDAPIFSKCDYGILGDIFEVVPALTQALEQD